MTDSSTEPDNLLPIQPQVGTKVYPGQYLKSSDFLNPNSAYAPRQVQLSLRANF